jgi:hypothetical protein
LPLSYVRMVGQARFPQPAPWRPAEVVSLRTLRFPIMGRGRGLRHDELLAGQRKVRQLLTCFGTEGGKGRDGVVQVRLKHDALRDGIRHPCEMVLEGRFVGHSEDHDEVGFPIPRLGHEGVREGEGEGGVHRLGGLQARG